MELNIYEQNKIVKTYQADAANISTGVAEDILEAVDVDKFIDGSISSDKMPLELLRTVTKSHKLFYPILADVFAGLTAEEYRKTRVQEVTSCIFLIITETIKDMFSIGGDQKKK